jgi:hypothetical protein
VMLLNSSATSTGHEMYSLSRFNSSVQIIPMKTLKTLKPHNSKVLCYSSYADVVFPLHGFRSDHFHF